MSAPYDGLVARHGLGASHRRIVELVPPDARVLDVGCAGGYLAEELARTRRATVVGIERDPAAAAAARARGIEVREADVEREPLGAEGFDAVVFGDVLEHLGDPAAVLRQARAAPLVVVSLPNIAHWSARRELLRGRFPREDFGLFDRTHLRFFTRAGAHELAAEAGFEVVAERFAAGALPLEGRLPVLGRLREPALRCRPELFALQVVLALAPRDGGA